jgi:hypothetical protein
MPAYSKEYEKEMIAHVRKILVVKPDASIRQINKTLAENNITMSNNYIMVLLRKIRNERANRYNNAAANTAIAKFEDFVKYVNNELLKIAQQDKSGMTRAIALASTVKHYKDILNLQFDMGVFERKLGSAKLEVTNIAEILKIITDAENKRTNNPNLNPGA